MGLFRGPRSPQLPPQPPFTADASNNLVYLDAYRQQRNEAPDKGSPSALVVHRPEGRPSALAPSDAARFKLLSEKAVRTQIHFGERIDSDEPTPPPPNAA